MSDSEAALISDDSFTALPGTVQTIEVDGELVYQADVTLEPSDKAKEVKAVVTLALSDIEAESEIRMLEGVFRPADPEESGLSAIRCYRLESDRLAEALTDLAFIRFCTAWSRGKTRCELWFAEHSALGRT